MRSLKIPQILICFFLLLVLNSKSIEDLKIYPIKDLDVYQDSIYIFVYIFLWNFLIEISLIIIFNFKQTAHYRENHNFINICIIVAQIVNNYWYMSKKNLDFSPQFLQTEVVLFFFELLQLILGFMVSSKAISIEINLDFYLYKMMHRTLGILIYFGRKYQIYFYLYYYLQNSNFLIPIIVITFLMIVTFSTHVFLHLLINKSYYDLEKKEDFIVNKSENKRLFVELLEKIEEAESEYFNPNISMLRISMIDEHTKTEFDKEMEKIPKFVIIQNYVFSLNEFKHPMGDFIFEGINGKDITREFNGLKSFRFENKKTGVVKNLKFAHSDRTMFYLNKNIIGKLKQKTFIENEQDSSLSNSMESFKFDKSENMKSKISRIHQNWSVDTSYNFSKSIALHFIKKCEKDYYVNLSCYWIDFFGKYFLTENLNKKITMYPILSFSPIYIEKKMEWYSSLKISFKTLMIENQNSDLKEIGNMYLVLQQQLDTQQRKLAESVDELKTCHLPLVCQNAEDFSPLNEGQKFKLSGPLGFGLNIKPEVTDKYLFLIKNEGIFPFLDFIEFLGQKTLIEMNKTDLPHPIFTKDYLYAYTNKPEFSFYWEISEDFELNAESCGIFQFELIELAYKNDSGNKINKLIKTVNIIKNKKNHRGIVRNFSNQIANNFNEVLEIMDNKTNNFSKILISGDDEFVNKILKENKYPEIKIQIL
jgi:hypothetical protein